MYKKFIQFVTCNVVLRDELPEKGLSFPMVEDDRTDANEVFLFKDVEMSSYSKMGTGLGKTECQDSFTVMHALTPHTHFFGVYDGHGVKGKEVSSYVSEHIEECINKNIQSVEKLAVKGFMKDFYKNTFKFVENKLNRSSINTSNSGTCCINVFISRGKCHVANLGDSRAVLARQDEVSGNIAVDLSEDHKPTREDERKRILEMGGRIGPVYYQGSAIGPLRVWTKTKEAGVAMTRVMGDVRGKKAGLISEPEVKEITLQASDKFIIAASDGLWDVMTSQEAVDYVAKRDLAGKPRETAARALLREARNKWSKLDENETDPYIDDITIVIAFLKPYSQDTMVGTIPELDAVTALG